MSTKGKVGWPRWAQQDGHKAQVRHWGAGRSQPRAEHPWGWDLSGSQGCALGLEQQNSPPRENPPMLHPHQASKTLRCTMLGLDGGPWIWSPPPPSPATGTSPTYPGEGAARLRSTGRAAWLLGSPRAAGRGRDVSAVPGVTGPSSCAFAPGAEGCWMTEPRPPSKYGGVVALFTECFSLLDNQITVNSQMRTKSKDPPGSRGGAVPAQPGRSQLPGVLTQHEELCGVPRPLCPRGTPCPETPPGGEAVPWSGVVGMAPSSPGSAKRQRSSGCAEMGMR